MNDTVAVVAVCIKNVLICAIFAYVAICFGKWWIVLFALLAHSSYRKTEKKDGE